MKSSLLRYCMSTLPALRASHVGVVPLVFSLACSAADGSAAVAGPPPAASATNDGPAIDDSASGTPARPQLRAEDAEANTLLRYFEYAGDLAAGLEFDPWDPRAGVGAVDALAADFVVASAGGSHTTLEAAIADATLVGGTERIYIRMEPGTYREVICVPAEAPPITLYSLAADASLTTVVFNNNQAKPKLVNQPANPCNPNLTGETFGTSGSATFAVYANGFRAKNISFANDFEENGLTMGTQAPALMTAADQLIFENIRVISQHDSLYPKTIAIGIVQRVYFKDIYVEGDEDFIFGRATAVFDHCTIHYLSSRRGPSNSGFGVVPSTDVRNDHGMLIIDSDLTAEPGTPDDSVFIGRAWDESQVDLATYEQNMTTGIFPNGKAVVRDSRLGPHIFREAPWAPSAIVGRPFHSTDTETPANRLYELHNSGPGSAVP